MFKNPFASVLCVKTSFEEDVETLSDAQFVDLQENNNNNNKQTSTGQLNHEVTAAQCETQFCVSPVITSCWNVALINWLCSGPSLMIQTLKIQTAV